MCPRRLSPPRALGASHHRAPAPPLTTPCHPPHHHPLPFLVHSQTPTAFLVVWYGGKFFGFLSTFGSNLLINDAAPDDEKGKWSGRSEATSAIAESVATLIMASVYDAMNDGSEDGKRGKIAIIITLSISVLAFLAYSPLLVFTPKGFLEEEDDKEVSKKFISAEEYTALSDAEVRKLTTEEMEYAEYHCMKAGKAPRMVSWGPYAEEHLDITAKNGIMDRSVKDFAFMKADTIATLASNAKMVERVEMWKGLKVHLKDNVDVAAHRAEMGAWIADYFDDAGYEFWITNPGLFKAMLINAFPPMCACRTRI